MHILLIKTSSLGDIIHAFPAITDALSHIPHLTIDWVVEENFADIPALHPGINRVIPVAIRRWRKCLFRSQTRTEIHQFLHELRQTSYDAIIDAQGLFKSAMIASAAKGPRWGFDGKSAREGWAASCYHHKIPVSKDLDALTRIRQLLASALGYPLPALSPDSGLPFPSSSAKNHMLFLPGTTWENKKWPVSYWVQLAQLAKDHSFTVDIPWSNETEYDTAQHIQTAGSHVTVLKKMTLKELASRLPDYRGVVAVDSGLGYLAAAFHVPTVMMFGPTSPDLLGTFPPFQMNLKSHLWCAPCRQRICHNPTPSPVWPPCFEHITPEKVWHTWQGLVDR